MATTGPPDDRVRREIGRLLPSEKLRFAITSEIGLFDGIMRHLGRALVDEAVHGLERRQHDLSATSTLSRGQAWIGAALLLLLEEGDDETIAAARSARLTPPMRPVIVPEAQPRTKPKACNVCTRLPPTRPSGSW